MKILISDGLSQDGQQILADNGIDFHIEHYEAEDLKRVIGDYDAILVRSATLVTREIIDAGRNLKAIARGGAGIDNIDHVYAKEKGIPVLNTPGANSASVAELVLAHLFALSRSIPQSNASIRAGRWEKKTYKGNEIAGKTLGIVGFGKIGQILAEKALGLGMNVLAYDVMPQKSDLDVRIVDLATIISESDVMSLHVPKLAQPLIGTDELAKMKKGAILINCARGGVVDEKALYEALKSGHLAGAGLDVFEKEPPAESELLSLPNVSVTPHIGASTIEAQNRVGTDIARKLVNTLKG